MTAENEVLIPAEVAAELRCNIRTVTALCKSGKLRSFTVGTHYRITRESLELYKAGETQAVAS